MVVAVLFPQLDNLDHLTRLLLPSLPHHEPLPESVIISRPTTLLPPLLQWLRAGERTRFPIENIQVMFQVKHLLLVKITALMASKQFASIPDLDMRSTCFRLHRQTGLQRNRISIRLHAHTAALVDHWKGDISRSKPRWHREADVRVPSSWL